VPIYEHRQLGKTILGIIGISLTLIGLLLALVPDDRPLIPVIAPILAVAVLVAFLFGSLTVVVTEERVTASLGLGLIRKSFRIEEIRDARAVRNHWYYGWGIRLTPTGWMFNVSGFDAVEIELKNGRRFRIGTDEPEQLLAAIKQAARLN